MPAPSQVDQAPARPYWRWHSPPAQMLPAAGAAYVLSPARQQIQNEIDALVAPLYGLSEEDLQHILYAPYTFPLVKSEIKDGVVHEFARVERLLEGE